MKRTINRLSSIDINHRSTKRRKQDSNNIPKYSTRIIPWSEQRLLPERFHRDGKGIWPASRILKERIFQGEKHYLVEWEPHPDTGEIFQPTWEPSEHIGGELEQEWELKHTDTSARRLQASSSSSPASSVSTRARPTLGTRRINNRRIVPDSSGEIQEIAPSEASNTPTLAGSPASIDTSVSLIEITETQQTHLADPLSINVPPPPADKTDYESVKSSQVSLINPELTPISPTGGTSLHNSQPIRAGTSLSQVVTPDYAVSPVIKSLRSQALAASKVPNTPRRILNYQPDTETSPSVGSSSPAVVEAQLSSNSIIHESRPRGKPSRRSTRLSRSPALNPVQSVTRHSTTKSPLTHSIGSHSPSIRASQPWAFHFQIPLENQTFTSSHSESGFGKVASATLPSLGLSQSSLAGNIGEKRFAVDAVGSRKKQHPSPLPGMASRATRQSPRLQAATPVLNGTSPRVVVRSNNSQRSRNSRVPEISSPLATTLPEFPEHGHQSADSSLISNEIGSMDFQEILQNPPTTIPPSSMHIDPTSLINTATHTTSDFVTMPIQQSIEEEPMSSNEDVSLESKASSSQESLPHERLIPHVDGVVVPTYPILGADEYIVPLPAEGKIQAIYSQTIKVKRKAMLRFIHRRGSVNEASTSPKKTIERNAMLELIQRLHDTTTHSDLGLPGTPTQYTVPSEEHVAYADYAGSKFVFIGCLVDALIRRDCAIAIMSNPGPIQDLLEEYFLMKSVSVTRHERLQNSLEQPQSQSSCLKVDLLSTKASEVVVLERSPSLVIAFDASFESQNSQLMYMRQQFSSSLPVVHLLVTNSSEHVERCLPISMPSPQRLNLLVRATFQAQDYLGGTARYLEASPSDADISQMDLGELTRAMRKAPKRRIARFAIIAAMAALSSDFAANWTVPEMAALELDELEETPPSSKESGTASATPNKGRARSQTPVSRFSVQRGRSQTPVSRLGTPNTRKRLLDIDSASVVAKRQRMTPVHEVAIGDSDTSASRGRFEELERTLDMLKADLAAEKRARLTAEEGRKAAERRRAEWQASLEQLQRRYEKRMKKSHEEHKTCKALTLTNENARSRIEKLNSDNSMLKSQLSQAKTDLALARDELKAVGGDTAALEFARQETREVVSKASVLEKSLNNIKRDFEFTRSQYQEASNKAAEFASQITDLETQNAVLAKQASGEKRRLQELNRSEATRKHLASIQRLELEKRNREVLLKKQEDEIRILKRSRGVQTRGSSVQPGSPGPRSRQASPASAYLAPPGSRAAVLRHER